MEMGPALERQEVEEWKEMTWCEGRGLGSLKATSRCSFKGPSWLGGQRSPAPGWPCGESAVVSFASYGLL